MPPGLDHLKRDALLLEEHTESLVVDVADHPLSHQELGQLGQAPGRKAQAVVDRTAEGDLLGLPTLGQGERRGPAACVLGTSESNPSSLKFWSTARTRSGEVNATWAIWATSMPWADSRTIWALHHVTTDPEDRQTISNG